MLHCRNYKAVRNIVLTHWGSVQNGQDFVDYIFEHNFLKVLIYWF